MTRLTEAGVDPGPQVFDVFQRVESAIRPPLTEDEVPATLRTLLEGIQHQRRL